MSATYYNWDIAPTELEIPIEPFFYIGFDATNLAPWAWPTGTQVGDMAIMYSNGNEQMSRAGWTSLASYNFNGGTPQGTSGFSIMYKVLVQADLDAAPYQPALSYGMSMLAIFRGVKSMAQKGVSPVYVGAQSTRDIPGFTKASDARYILVTQNSWDINAYPGWASPPGFTSIYGSKGVAGYFSLQMFYMLASDYVDGTPITTGVMAGSEGSISIAYEIKGN